MTQHMPYYCVAWAKGETDGIRSCCLGDFEMTEALLEGFIKKIQSEFKPITSKELDGFFIYGDTGKTKCMIWPFNAEFVEGVGDVE